MVNMSDHFYYGSKKRLKYKQNLEFSIKTNVE